FDRSEKAHRLFEGAESAVQQKGCGGLAVRSRDADELDLRVRLSIEGPRCQGQGAPDPLHANPLRGKLGGSLAFAHDSEGPALQGGADEVVAIGLFSSNGKEERSRLDATGVVGKGVNLQGRVCTRLDDVHFSKQSA